MGGSCTQVWIDPSPGLTRVLFCAHGDAGTGQPGEEGAGVCEIWHEFDRPGVRVGSVHVGRVERVFAAHNRASVVLEDGAVISCRIKHKDEIKQGAAVTVTVTAAAREAKPAQALLGARLVSRWFVLLPDAEGLQYSRALSQRPDAAMHASLCAVIADAGFPCGAIMRRGADGIDLQSLIVHLRRLIDEWRADASRLHATMTETGRPAFSVFDGGRLANRIWRAVGDVPQLTTDARFQNDAAAPGPSPQTFDAAYDAVMDQMARDDWRLPSGGVLWVERTRALTAIDLDSAQGSLDQLLAQAPTMIARCLRLRGDGGVVVIDVPRASAAAMKTFNKALEQAFANDPRGIDILGRSRAGMLECRIPHGATPTVDLARDKAVQTELAALTGIRNIARRPEIAQPQLGVSPAIADWLTGAGASVLAQLDRDVRLVVLSDTDIATVLD